jgi:hypothetical protein
MEIGEERNANQGDKGNETKKKDRTITHWMDNRRTSGTELLYSWIE